MPLTLRDLAPLLTPYQAPAPLNLSGFADQMSHNTDREQVRAIADQTNAQQQAVLAETVRSNQADEQSKRDAAAALLARQQHEEQLKAIGQAPMGIDPAKQAAVEAQLRGVGFGLKRMEAPDVNAAGAAPTAAPIDNPDQPLSQWLEAQAGASGLGFAPDRTMVMHGDKPVMTLNYGQQRQDAVDAVQNRATALARGASGISAPAFQQAAGAVPETVAAEGFDAGAANKSLDAIAKEEAMQANANARSHEQSVSKGLAAGAGDDKAVHGYVENIINKTALNDDVKLNKSRLASSAQVVDLLSGSNPMANKDAMIAQLRSMFGGRITNQSIGMLLNADGKWSRWEMEANSVIDGGAMPPGFKQHMLQAQRTLQHTLLVQNKEAGQEAYDAVMNDPLIPIDKKQPFADYAFGRITGHHSGKNPDLSGGGGGRVSVRGSATEKGAPAVGGSQSEDEVLQGLRDQGVVP